MSQYRLLDELGRGGMGVVYRAEDIRLGRHVALKLLPDRLVQDPVAMERFQREARATSGLNHPNICVIYDFGELDGKPFISMELLDGETLRHRLHHKPLKIDLFLRLAIQMAEALHAAHSKGVVHRDVKPSNIFLTRRGEVKLMDFGLAKHVPRGVAMGSAAGSSVGSGLGSTALEAPEEDLTSPGIAVGTVAYMSPEQARGEALDARTDLFSLGAVFYEMASGRTAFPGDTTAVIFEAILNRQPETLTSRNALLPLQLDSIVSKALEKDREMRYQTAAEIRSDLKRLQRDLESARVRAATVVPIADPRSAGRRTRIRYAVAGVLLLASLVGLAAWRLGWLPPRGPAVVSRIQQRQLTTNQSNNPVSVAAISHDGTYVAYVDQDGLKVQTVGTGEISRLPSPPGAPAITDIAWHPDDSGLFVSAGHEWNEAGMDLWTIPLVAGTPRKLREGARSPALSPDGTLMAFVAGSGSGGSGGREQIWVMGPAGQSPRRIYTAQEGSSLEHPVWAPSGTRIAFARVTRFQTTGPMVSFENIGLDGRNRSTITSGDLADFEGRIGLSGYAWLRDGRFVFARSEPAPNVSDLNLWCVRCDPKSGSPRGQPSRLTNWSGFLYYGFSETRGGEQVLLKVSAHHEICVADLTPGRTALTYTTTGTRDDADDTDGRWSLDSKAFVYSSNRRGNYNVYLQSLGSPEPEVISAGPEDEISPRFAQGGEDILFGTRRPRESSGTYWVWISGEIKRVPRSGGIPSTVAKLPSGRSVVLLSGSAPSSPSVLVEWSESQVIYSHFDTKTGSEKFLLRLPRAEYWSDALSPDGQKILRFQGPPGKVQIVDLETRSPREISLEGEGWIAGAAWAPDGSGVFLSVQRPDGWAILSMDLSGRSRTLWKTADRWFYPQFLDVSPDGRRLLSNRLVVSGNVWLVAGM